MSRLASFTALALLLMGCPSDGSSAKTDGSDVALTIAATNACGKNVLPVPTRDQLVGGEALTMTVTVRGVDPNNSSGAVVGGTEVELFGGDQNEDPPTPTQGGWFVSAVAAGNALEARNISEGIKFTGFTARGAFHCVERGDHFLHARLIERNPENRAEKFVRYRPGGVGEYVEVYTQRTRGFPVRCVTPAQYIDECGALPGELGPLEFGTDATDGGDASDAEMGIDMEFVPSWRLEYIPLNPGDEIIGIRGAASGRPSQVELKFQVKELDLPVPGVEVKFSRGDTHPPGLNIDPRDDVAVTADRDGIATVTLIASGSPGVATVSARASRDFEADTPENGCQSSAECGADSDCTDDSCDVCVDQVCYERQFQDSTSQVITIRAGIPSHRGLQFACEHNVLPAFTGRRVAEDEDATRGWSLSNEPGTDCFVQVADRVNGRVDTGTQVFFLAEAGTVTQAATADEDGRAATHHRLGLPPPLDVDPEPYEVQAGYPGPFNPRDGLVRLVAVTRGEEDFLDLNGNKVFDEDDLQHPWHQLSDPYIDSNDDGVFNIGEEEYRDGDDDGEFTEPNFEWDADLEIWTTTTVLWVGDFSSLERFVPPEERLRAPACSKEVRFDCLDPEGETCLLNPSIPPDPADPEGHYNAPTVTGVGGGFRVTVTLRDINGNCLFGRGEGTVSIGIAGEWNIGGNPEEVALEGCGTADGAVLGGSVSWIVRSSVPPGPEGMDPFVREADELTIDGAWARTAGRADAYHCAVNIGTIIGEPPMMEGP